MENQLIIIELVVESADFVMEAIGVWVTASLKSAFVGRLQSSDYSVVSPYREPAKHSVTSWLSLIVTSFIHSECHSPKGTSTRGH